MAASTRAAAAAGSSLTATEPPAADMAPKKIRVKVSSICSSRPHASPDRTERTISSTMAYVERSSCSRKRSCPRTDGPSEMTTCR